MTEFDEDLAEIAQAEMGEKAREFLESELGRCLVGMADQDVQAAKDALAEVDLGDIEKVRALQNKAALGRMFTSYLAEIVSRGNEAISILRESQRRQTP